MAWVADAMTARMRIPSRAVRVARGRIPFFPLFPLVPLALLTANVTALVMLFRRVQRIDAKGDRCGYLSPRRSEACGLGPPCGECVLASTERAIDETRRERPPFFQHAPSTTSAWVHD